MMKKMHMMIVAAMLAGLFGSAGAQDNGISTLRQTSQAFTSVASSATPAVVFIEAEMEVQGRDGIMPGFPFGDQFGEDFFDRFFRERDGQGRRRQPRKQRQVGQGSGFIVSEDGYILTNHHVIGEADKITVKLTDGREFEAEIVGSDEKSDVAVIKVEGDGLPYIELGDSDAMQIGEWVIAIGNPFGLNATLTVGVVSAKGRSRVGITDYEDFIQTDAAINPGNSGGPLLNLDGKAIGMNTAIFSRSGGYMGIGFAIPSNMAKLIKEQLITQGKVTRGRLGVLIQDIDPDLAESFGLDASTGVVVAQVMEDSPAEDAGLEPGDILLKVDDLDVSGVGQLRNSIAMLAPGTEVTITIYRDGAEKQVKAEIGEAPDEGLTVGRARGGARSDFGIRVRAINAELIERYSLEVEQGVVVTEVDVDSPAERAGLKEGMVVMRVGRKRIKTLVQFREAMKALEDEDRVRLLVRQGSYDRFVLLERE